MPNELMGKLIGAKGSNKKLIEEDTGAKIQIPRREETGPVGEFRPLPTCFNGITLVITSTSRESVERCYDRIEMLIFDNRKKLNFTHFVLIPIEDKELMKKHEKLVDNIRSSSKVDVRLSLIIVLSPLLIGKLQGSSTFRRPESTPFNSCSALVIIPYRYEQSQKDCPRNYCSVQI